MEKKKNGFVSGIGFILAAAGSAIGLGNLWSFPYKTSENGGAAFVLVYILSVIVIGSIVMLAEMYLGKRAQANPITSYKKTHKILGFIGIVAIFIPFLIACYYSILGGFTIKYAINSFNDNTTILNSFSSNKLEVITFTGIFILLALLVVMAGVNGGIEKASKILMPTLFFILLFIVIYCLTLGDGVQDGLSYFLKPDFASLGFKGVLAAMGQAFYSLSLGMGIMVSYGSYTNKEIKLGKSCLMICIFDTLIAILAGLAIFPAIYHYNSVSGTDLALEGPMLLFESLPLVFDTLGVFGKIISFLFFGMVIVAALTSVISLFEVVTQFVIQKMKVKRKIAILIVGIISFVIAIPISISFGYSLNDSTNMQIFGMDYLSFFDTLSNIVLMPICAFASCISIGWFVSKPKNIKDLFSPNFTCNSLTADGLDLGLFSKYFTFMVKYITPILIIVIEIFGIVDLIKVNGLNGLGIFLVGIGIIIISFIIYIIFIMNKDTGCNEDELILNEKNK